MLTIYDVVIDAGFEAKELVASGACFVCDCSNGSTCIPDIAKAAKEGKGHVTFINCNSPHIKQIRELGGDKRCIYNQLLLNILRVISQKYGHNL